MEKISKWDELKEFFSDRRTSPWEHPEYILYFLIVIIGFGAIGIWTSWYTESIGKIFNHASLLDNIANFSVAIVATGSIELMFVKKDTIRRTLFLISIGYMLVAGLGFFFTINCNSTKGYWIAIPLGILALYIWWIANADNANLTENFFKQQSNATKELGDNLDDYDK